MEVALLQTAFFKCKNWQLEETLDPDTCPYHYYCNSSYPGNYSPAIDLLVLLFTLASFSLTATFMVMDMAGRSRRRQWLEQSRRYLVPSGPVGLPIAVLILAKGYRINTLSPMTSLGPAILQLIRISAIAFDNDLMSDVKYVFLESSTISGILHSALYLDSVVLPFYTGLDALTSSTLTGECRSCVCRDRALKVGGALVRFRGWSVTTAVVVGSLCLRIVGRVWREAGRKSGLMRLVLESLSWALIAAESVYLVRVPRVETALAADAAYAGVFTLMGFQIVRKVCKWIVNLKRSPLQTGSAKGLP